MDVAIRRARQDDLAALGRLGADLWRSHHALDPARFMAPGPDPAAGYARFLGTQLERDAVRVFVAEVGEAVVGYVLAAIEPRDWMALADEAGYIHDLVVAPTQRGRGIARRLVHEALEWLRAAGMPRVILWTAVGNQAAFSLFARAGFRQTTIEMTKEL